MGVWLWGPLAVFEKAVQAWDGAVQNSCICSCSNRQFWSCTFLCNWSWRRAVAQTIQLTIQPTISLFRSKIVGISKTSEIRSLLNWLLAGRKAVGRQQQQTATIITTTLQLVFPFWQVAKLLPHNHLPVKFFVFTIWAEFLPGPTIGASLIVAKRKSWPDNCAAASFPFHRWHNLLPTHHRQLVKLFLTKFQKTLSCVSCLIYLFIQVIAPKASAEGACI